MSNVNDTAPENLSAADTTITSARPSLEAKEKPCNPQIDILSGDILPLVGPCKKILGDQRGEHWRLFRYIAGKP